MAAGRGCLCLPTRQRANRGGCVCPLSGSNVEMAVRAGGRRAKLALCSDSASFGARLPTQHGKNEQPLMKALTWGYVPRWVARDCRVTRAGEHAPAEMVLYHTFCLEVDEIAVRACFWPLVRSGDGPMAAARLIGSGAFVTERQLYERWPLARPETAPPAVMGTAVAVACRRGMREAPTPPRPVSARGNEGPALSPTRIAENGRCREFLNGTQGTREGEGRKGVAIAGTI